MMSLELITSIVRKEMLSTLFTAAGRFLGTAKRNLTPDFAGFGNYDPCGRNAAIPVMKPERNPKNTLAGQKSRDLLTSMHRLHATHKYR